MKTIQDAKKQRSYFDLNSILIRKGSHKSEEQKIAIANLNKVYNTLEDFVQLFNNFPEIAKDYHQNKCCKDYQ